MAAAVPICFKTINFKQHRKDSPPNKYHNRNLYVWWLNFDSAVLNSGYRNLCYFEYEKYDMSKMGIILSFVAGCGFCFFLGLVSGWQAGAEYSSVRIPASKEGIVRAQ